MSKQYRCKVCGLLGHNSRTCGKTPPDSDKSRVKRSPKLPRTLGGDPSIQKDSGSSRRCGYCGRTGHQVRNCITLLNHEKTLTELGNLVYSKAEKLLSEGGYAPGCLLGVSSGNSVSIHADLIDQDINKLAHIFPTEILRTLRTLWERLQESHANLLKDWNPLTLEATFVGLQPSSHAFNLNLENPGYLRLSWNKVLFAGSSFSPGENLRQNEESFPEFMSFLRQLLDLEVAAVQKEPDSYWSFNVLSREVKNAIIRVFRGDSLNLTLDLRGGNSRETSLPGFFNENLPIPKMDRTDLSLEVKDIVNVGNKPAYQKRNMVRNTERTINYLRETLGLPALPFTPDPNRRW